MIIDPAELERRDRYRWLISALVPRPIAWVSSLDGDGRPNLAPFSFFGGVCSDPMTVMLSVGRRAGMPKDTGRNLRATGEAVVHIPTVELAEKMVLSSGDYPSGTDEFELCGLARQPAERVAPPRLTEAAIAMEARVVQHQEVGNGPVDLFLLEVLRLHVRDDILKDGRIDPHKLRAVGRMGGIGYCETDSLLQIPRPVAD